MKAGIIDQALQIETCPKTRVMSGKDQLDYFAPWVYNADRDVFLEILSMNDRTARFRHLSVDAFDRLKSGSWLFHYGWKNGEAQFTESAAHAFAHSRVAYFPKFESRSKDG